MYSSRGGQLRIKRPPLVLMRLPQIQYSHSMPYTQETPSFCTVSDAQGWEKQSLTAHAHTICLNSCRQSPLRVAKPQPQVTLPITTHGYNKYDKFERQSTVTTQVTHRFSNRTFIASTSCRMLLFSSSTKSARCGKDIASTTNILRRDSVSAYLYKSGVAPFRFLHT